MIYIDPHILNSYDPDAQIFFTAAGITDSTQKTAINDLVVELKAQSLWSLLSVIYPLVGGTADSHSYNLRDTTVAQITWVNAPTQNANGVTFNGTTQYGDTNYSTSSQNNKHVSLYSRSSQARSGADMGARNASNRRATIITRNVSANWQATINAGLDTPAANADGKGHYIASRLVAATANYFKNGVVTDDTRTSATATTVNWYLGAENNSGPTIYSDRNMAFFTIGDGLTDTQGSDLYDAIQTFQTTLSRQV